MKTLTELIREETGMTRAAFSRKYNIPKRTLEAWDAGIRESSRWAVDLLARAVLEDLCGQINPVFEVIEIGENDERLVLRTNSYTEAILVARDLEERKSTDAVKHLNEIRYNIIEKDGGIDYNTLNY